MQIGEKLKEARLEKKLSLDEVHKRTKIQLRYLEAVEENNFSHIPGSFYVRVFIKEYANTVGLNADELFQEHQDELPLSDDTIDYSQLKRSRRKSTSAKTSPFARIIPTIVVLILIIGVVFYIWTYALDRGDSSNNGSGDTPGTDQPAGDEVIIPPIDQNDQEDPETDDQDQTPDNVELDDVEEVFELSLVSFENNVSNYQLTTNEEALELMIESSGANWLEVESDDGERLFYETLRTSGSPVTFDVSDEMFIYLRFGNPGDISIFVNDSEIELAEEMSQTQVQELWLYINEDPM